MAEKAIICACLDITADDLDRAIAAGFRDPETFKRYTACFMGPCQGKSCMDTIVALIAERTGADPATLRRPTLRPPVHPIRLGVLAGLGGNESAAGGNESAAVGNESAAGGDENGDGGASRNGGEGGSGQSDSGEGDAA